MSFLAQAQVGEAFPPFVAFKTRFGFVPNLFRAQTLLPRVIEAEAGIAAAVLLAERALTRIQKERLLLTLAAAEENTYCVTAHAHLLRGLGVSEERIDRLIVDHHDAGLPAADTGLLDFALKLGQSPTAVSRGDIDALRRHGFGDEAILEAVLVTALTRFLSTLSVGLGVVTDFAPRRITPRPVPWSHRETTHTPAKPEPYLRAAELTEESFPPFAFFRERFGFIPNIFRAQTLRPDVVEAEAEAVRTILLTEDVLSRAQKEYILLVVSAANLNTYCVAVHCEMLRALGVPPGESDQIAVDHHLARLPAADSALLDFALRLGVRPTDFSSADIDALRQQGFTEAQILEAVVMTALTNFLNTLQMGLGPVPDFAPRLVFGNEEANLFPPRGSLKREAHEPPPTFQGVDEDADLVERVQNGDLDAFEELVRRHERRLYRVVLSITGRREDAEDGMQNAFLKAFRSIAHFQGASRFATWLTRIGINEGLERLRERKGTAVAEEESRAEETFRPRHVEPWQDDPEHLYSRAEVRALVERELMNLPPKYRLAVVLRDIEQLSGEEAAAAMGLGVPTLKTRLLRGRLMLREALAPHFARGATGGGYV